MSSCLFLAHREVEWLNVLLIQLAPVESLDLFVWFLLEVQWEPLDYFG